MTRFAGGSLLVWSAQRALRAAKAPFYRKKKRALSWFKDSATEHIAQIRELMWMVENHGVYVRTLKAERVGYVVYEDEYQIVAEPFSDTIC